MWLMLLTMTVGLICWKFVLTKKINSVEQILKTKCYLEGNCLKFN